MPLIPKPPTQISTDPEQRELNILDALLTDHPRPPSGLSSQSSLAEALSQLGINPPTLSSAVIPQAQQQNSALNTIEREDLNQIRSMADGRASPSMEAFFTSHDRPPLPEPERLENPGLASFLHTFGQELQKVQDQYFKQTGERISAREALRLKQEMEQRVLEGEGDQ